VEQPDPKMMASQIGDGTFLVKEVHVVEEYQS